ncbi:MAG: hypothetical protein EXR28_02625 [Betaproteobacteria bacterium]|nr:hypothetical protein [Betaproteobacteria bacterium]
MNSMFRHILLALALLFSQQAAQLHGLSHAKSDLAAAMGGEKKAPPAGHPAEQCLAFHAVDSVLPGIAQVSLVACGLDESVVAFELPLFFGPRIVFDSRAPPLHS